MSNKNGIKITAFTGEEIEMHCALVSGVVTDDKESPMSLYSGTLDLEQIHSVVFYANRAVIKILVDEFGIPLENAEEFLISAVTESVTEEFNARVSGNPDVDIRKVIRAVRKNQN